MSDVGKASDLTPEQRRDIVLEFFAGRKVADIVREHQLSSVTIYKWRDQVLEGGLASLKGNRPSEREVAQEREIAKLKELVGDLSVANYALKKGGALSTGRKGGRGA